MCVFVACGEHAQPTELAPYLTSLAGGDPAVVRREVASWRLDEPGWRRIVVDPYRAVHADYARAFDAATERVIALLARGGAITVRAQFADDPQLTIGEARTRWALPVAFAAQVATIGGDELDVVFVRDGDRWRAIGGLDAVIRARVEALDPACATRIDVAAGSRRCREVAWEVVEAALRNDTSRFVHACTLTTTPCGKPSP